MLINNDETCQLSPFAQHIQESSRRRVESFMARVVWLSSQAWIWQSSRLFAKSTRPVFAPKRRLCVGSMLSAHCWNWWSNIRQMIMWRPVGKLVLTNQQSSKPIKSIDYSPKDVEFSTLKDAGPWLRLTIPHFFSSVFSVAGAPGLLDGDLSLHPSLLRGQHPRASRRPNLAREISQQPTIIFYFAVLNIYIYMVFIRSYYYWLFYQTIVLSMWLVSILFVLLPLLVVVRIGFGAKPPFSILILDRWIY